MLVFENGMGMGLGNWNTIMDSLANNAPVFLYDRQGVEKSDKVFQMPTPQKIAANLKLLLSELKIEPPYILIGHSMGGVYVRAFAGYYPNDIAGLVFVDPADFTETKADWNQIFRAIGVSEKRIDEMLDEAHPALVAVSETVQQVEGGITPVRAGLITWRQIYRDIAVG